MASSWQSLNDILAEAHRVGWLGIDDVDAVRIHAGRFVRALEGCQGPVADVGTGPGIPGLIIAEERPDLRVVLVDRRASRIDFLQRAIRALGWQDRVTAVEGVAPEVVGVREWAGSFAAVVARSFGAPTETLRCSRPFLGIGGRLIVSEPPNRGTSRWDQDLVRRFGFSPPVASEGLAMFHVEHSAE